MKHESSVSHLAKSQPTYILDPMKQKDERKVEHALAEKYQLKDVVWALKHRVSRWRAQLAVRSIRSQAYKDGLDTMTDQDIKVLIKKTRASRRR